MTENARAALEAGRARLAERHAAEALALLTHAYETAAAQGDEALAAAAALGCAQAEFALGRLEAAARRAALASDLLAKVASPEVRTAVNLIAQIEHYRYLTAG